MENHEFTKSKSSNYMYVSLRPVMEAPLYLVHILYHFKTPKVCRQKNMNQKVGVYLEVTKL